MAGDWLKVEVSLPDKPEVWQIAGILGIDPDAVVGKLIRVWRWFDAHTESGNAVGVTYALLDRHAGVTGFAEAMAMAGWLVERGSDVSIPHFEWHNGKTAKNRALTAKRAASHREKSNDGSVTSSVTVALPREEKRREENKEQKLGASAAKRGTRLTAAWEPTVEGQELATTLGVDWRRELARFVDYWTAKPGQGGVKLDWDATWRNWIRRATPSKVPASAPAPRPESFGAAAALKRSETPEEAQRNYEAHLARLNGHD